MIEFNSIQLISVHFNSIQCSLCLVVQVVILIALCAVGLVANLTVLRAALRIRTFARQTSCLYVALVCADFLICSTRVPTSIYLVFSYHPPALTSTDVTSPLTLTSSYVTSPLSLSSTSAVTHNTDTSSVTLTLVAGAVTSAVTLNFAGTSEALSGAGGSGDSSGGGGGGGGMVNVHDGGEGGGVSGGGGGGASVDVACEVRIYTPTFY
jgi:hypothetical protein